MINYTRRETYVEDKQADITRAWRAASAVKAQLVCIERVSGKLHRYVALVPEDAVGDWEALLIAPEKERRAPRATDSPKRPPSCANFKPSV